MSVALRVFSWVFALKACNGVLRLTCFHYAKVLSRRMVLYFRSKSYHFSWYGFVSGDMQGGFHGWWHCVLFPLSRLESSTWENTYGLWSKFCGCIVGDLLSPCTRAQFCPTRKDLSYCSVICGAYRAWDCPNMIICPRDLIHSPCDHRWRQAAFLPQGLLDKENQQARPKWCASQTDEVCCGTSCKSARSSVEWRWPNAPLQKLCVVSVRSIWRPFWGLVSQKADIWEHDRLFVTTVVYNEIIDILNVVFRSSLWKVLMELCVADLGERFELRTWRRII